MKITEIRNSLYGGYKGTWKDLAKSRGDTLEEIAKIMIDKKKKDKLVAIEAVLKKDGWNPEHYKQ